MEIINGVPVLGSEDAAALALNKIQSNVIANEQDIQTGLNSQWIELNAAVGRYWKFGDSYVICGGSGTGKSYFLNTLVSDFTRCIDMPLEFTQPYGNIITKIIPALNANFKNK